MSTHQVYASKAEKYARYRWDYPAEAVEAIFSTAQVTSRSIVADIGAGTGILTRHFAGRVQQVYAIEPNLEMRREAARRLPVGSGCAVLGGSAEAIPLPDHSVDLIIVAQAIHWCNPEPTRREFLRVLKPGGWLALISNHPVERAAGDNFPDNLNRICTLENGVNPAKGSPPEFKRPSDFYFGGSHYQSFNYSFDYQQDWESFIGSLCSASYMPDEDHPAYPRFEKAARELFDRFSLNGKLPGSGVTSLQIGQIIEPGV